VRRVRLDQRDGGGIVLGQLIEALLHVGVLRYPVAANHGEIGFEDPGVLVSEVILLQFTECRLVIFQQVSH